MTESYTLCRKRIDQMLYGNERGDTEDLLDALNRVAAEWAKDKARIAEFDNLPDEITELQAIAGGSEAHTTRGNVALTKLCLLAEQGNVVKGRSFKGMLLEYLEERKLDLTHHRDGWKVRDDGGVFLAECFATAEDAIFHAMTENYTDEL